MFNMMTVLCPAGGRRRSEKKLFSRKKPSGAQWEWWSRRDSRVSSSLSCQGGLGLRALGESRRKGHERDREELFSQPLSSQPLTVSGWYLIKGGSIFGASGQ